MKPKTLKKQGPAWLMALPLYLFTLVFVLGPLVYMLVLSFLRRAEVWGVTGQLTLENYKNILAPVYLRTFVESFRLAVTSTLLIALIGYPFGYFMAKLRGRWKQAAMLALMIPFWTSSLIRLYGWIVILRSGGALDQLLMGLGLTDSPLRMLYTYPAVVAGMVYALLPFMILAVYSSAEKMDWSLVEAARDLGASAPAAFLTVTLPLITPAILSGMLLSFAMSMDDVIISIFVTGVKVNTLPIKIYSQIKFGVTPEINALCTLMLLATILLVLLSQWIGRPRKSDG